MKEAHFKIQKPLTLSWQTATVISFDTRLGYLGTKSDFVICCSICPKHGKGTTKRVSETCYVHLPDWKPAHAV